MKFSFWYSLRLISYSLFNVQQYWNQAVLSETLYQGWYESCPLSYQQYIGSLLQPVTECFLTNYKLPPPFHTWQEEDEADGAGAWWREQEIQKKKGGREREKGEALRWIKAERGFKEVVTCVYVSPGLIFWMTCLHLGVITALLLTLCSTLFSSKFFGVVALEINPTRVFAVSAGSSFVFPIESDKFYRGVHLELSPETSLFSTGKAEQELAR